MAFSLPSLPLFQLSSLFIIYPIIKLYILFI